MALREMTSENFRRLKKGRKKDGRQKRNYVPSGKNVHLKKSVLDLSDETCHYR